MSNCASTRSEPVVPRIAVTPGEPAGIGPDLALALATHPHPARLVLIADPALLEQRAAQLGLPARLREYHPDAPPEPDCIEVLPCRLASPVNAGTLNPTNARYVLDCLDIAARGCLASEFHAMLTGPVHKGVINDAGIPFTGHTEYLAAHANVTPVMMLTAGTLRVALVTTHLPLRAVPAAITPDLLRYTLDTVHAELRGKFGIAVPRLAVCGLNPHAGEGGHLGREEVELITPLLAEWTATGRVARGPLPADTAFTPDVLNEVDVVVAMYHDQGLAPLKALGFGQAINLTLGLPFIRTSVDHGTALELAGTGRARVDSMLAALHLAAELAARAASAAHA